MSTAFRVYITDIYFPHIENKSEAMLEIYVTMEIKGHMPSVTRRLKRDTNCSHLILLQKLCMGKTEN